MIMSITVRIGFVIFLLLLLGSFVSCKSPERILVHRAESFSFDCASDESVYYAQRLGDWSEVTEESENYYYLNLKFQYLTAEKLLRVTCASAQWENSGYYGCRKPNWSSTSMNRIFQLIVSDVQSFYWTYVCHGPAGSCERIDESTDDYQSVFNVADQTKADLFCCASTTGYSNVQIRMNPVGDQRSRVTEQRREDLDGSAVICAKQHPFFIRSSSISRTLTCELIVDQQSYGTYTSRIVIQDPMPLDPDVDYSLDHTTRSSSSNDDDYFSRTRRPLSGGGIRKKLSTGKKLAIILGSTFGGVFLLAVILSLSICLCHKKKVSKKSSKSPDSITNERKKPMTSTEESGYVEATPLYVNTPVTLRL